MRAPPPDTKKHHNVWLWTSLALAIAVVGLLVWGLNKQSDLDNANDDLEQIQNELNQPESDADQAQKDAAAAKQDAAESKSQTDKANAQADEAKAGADAAKSKAAIVKDAPRRTSRRSDSCSTAPARTRSSRTSRV